MTALLRKMRAEPPRARGKKTHGGGGFHSTAAFFEAAFRSLQPGSNVAAPAALCAAR